MMIEFFSRQILLKKGVFRYEELLYNHFWALIRSKDSGVLAKKYLDLICRKGKKKAIVAIDRKLAEIFWHLVKQKVFYKDIDIERYKRKMNIVFHRLHRRIIYNQ